MRRRTTRTNQTLVGMAVLLATAFSLLVITPAANAATGPSIQVTSSLNPSEYGQRVSVRATITDPAVPKGELNGTVTFLDGTTVVATKSASYGKASWTTAGLTPGDHSIVAVYTKGTTTITSPALVQHVNPGSSAITLTTPSPEVYLGKAGGVTATVKPVAPATGTPTGEVEFFDDDFYLATIPLSSTGKAVLPFAQLSPGIHQLTATYTGSDIFVGATTATALTQNILVNVPVATASFTPNTVAPGATVTLVVSATNTGPTALNSNVALGVAITLPVQSVTWPKDALWGHRPGLYYSLISLPRGATRSITLKITAPATPGVYTVGSYAGNIDTGDQTTAVATLTVA
jgi:hypothetical protein